MKVCALSGVQICNPSNQSASDLHLDHMATQTDRFVDTIILLIFVQRYRHNEILCIITVILGMNRLLGEVSLLTLYYTPNPVLETILLIRIHSDNEKFCKI